MKDFRIFGTHGRIRTSGLPLRRRPLYPTELRGQDLEKYKLHKLFCQQTARTWH